MKAYVYGANGAALTETPAPVPGAEQVLIRVRACGLNRADLGMAKGHAHGSAGGAGTVLGMEWAGEVTAIGAKVTGIAPGQRVMASGGGGFAEYAVTDYGRVLPVPDGMSDEEAATLPIALTTMHDALITNGALQAGQSVLVQGASAGVGLMALQIAQLKGAKPVIGSSTNAARRARLTEFGADIAIDSNDADWVEQVLKATDTHGVDLVIDQVSGALANQTLAATRVKGRIVNVGRLGGSHADFNFDLHAARRVTYIGVTFRTRSVAEIRDIFRRVRDDIWPDIQAGRLRLPIDRVYPFAEIAAALNHMQSNRHFGKIVVRI